MKQKDIIDGFVQLGKIMSAIAQEESYNPTLNCTEELYTQLNSVINKQYQYNGWFTKESVLFSLLSHSEMLAEQTLTDFASSYSFANNSKNVAVIMAGNLPLVGFHDFLCVLLSGHAITIKLSSDDKTLLPALIAILNSLDERFKTKIHITSGPIKNIDAVIATGSDNSLKYFKEYFGKYPHIFRKNRTSIAVLEGDETPEEIAQLGKDIFQYFGLGCRNVSHLLCPKGFDINRFFEGIYGYGDIINHHKYANNFDYNRAVYLLNQIPILENGFLILRETTDLHSSLAMLNYHFYESQAAVDAYIAKHKDEIQVVVGKNFTPFGLAQTPRVTDFADNVDTMRFLSEL